MLKCDHPLNPNIFKEEAVTLKELKQDKSRVILTGDKETTGGTIQTRLDQ